MPTPDDLHAPLRRTIAQATRQIDTLSARIEAGEITVDQWRDGMTAIIEAQTEAALTAGAHQPTDAAELIKRLVQVQLDFLAVFAADILTNGWLGSYRSRAQMYGEATKVAYWQGDIYRKAGRFLPLPSMPAEGTICLGRCGCFWEIETIDADQGDYDAYWKRGKADSCATCVQRAIQWSPVRIRGGELM
jgi:hypothetical protein